MSFPSTMTWPSVILSIPPIIFSRVLLPHPLSPRTTTSSPGYTSRSTPLRICRISSPLMNSFMTPRTRTTGSRSSKGLNVKPLSSMSRASMAQHCPHMDCSSSVYSASLPVSSRQPTVCLGVFIGTHSTVLLLRAGLSAPASFMFCTSAALYISGSPDSTTCPTRPSPGPALSPVASSVL